MKDHAHKENGRSKEALKIAILATAGIFVIEVAGGLWTNSLALLSDSVHVFMDLLSFILSLFAMIIAERAISDKKTFGWHRIEVFAALLNTLTVFAVALVIFFSALKRLRNPEEVLSREMLAIALFGFFVNLFVVWKLHPHLGKDLNVRSAYLHALGDALASVAVVICGFIVLTTRNYVVDPIGAMFVSVIIVVSAYKLFSDSMEILLEGVPKGLAPSKISECIESISGGSVKDLHVWNICSHLCALSVHVTIQETRMGNQQKILEDVRNHLHEKFGIAHTTIQIESDQWKQEGGVRHHEEKSEKS